VYGRIQPIVQRAISDPDSEWNEMMHYPLHLQEAYAALMTGLMHNPDKMAALQREYWENCTNLWANTLRRFQGANDAPLIKPEPGDKRFKSPEWHENLLYDFIRQSYLLTRQWMMKA